MRVQNCWKDLLAVGMWPSSHESDLNSHRTDRLAQVEILSDALTEIGPILPPSCRSIGHLTQLFRPEASLDRPLGDASPLAIEIVRHDEYYSSGHH